MTKDILCTQRLRLRSTAPTDLGILYERVFADRDVMRFVLGGMPFTRQQTAEFFETAFDHEGSGLQLGVLVEKETSEVLGFAGLLECTALGQRDYEIGFVLSRSAWGKGYATEIGLGQLNYGFGVARCKRILAQVASENSRSIAALRRIGMTFHSNVVTEGRGPRQVYFVERPE